PSLHDALPISDAVLTEFPAEIHILIVDDRGKVQESHVQILDDAAGFEDALERGPQRFGQMRVLDAQPGQFFVRNNHAAHHHDAGGNRDRKSTRLNSSHVSISYAVFCLKKKKKIS